MAEKRHLGVIHEVMSRLMQILPLSWVTAIGAYLGKKRALLAIRAQRQWVARMHGNLQSIAGMHEQSERERFIIQWSRNLGSCVAEHTVMRRLVEQGKIEVIGLERLANTTPQVIFTFGHTGNWELIFHISKFLKNQDISDLYTEQAPDQRWLRMITKEREVWGGRVNFVLAGPSSVRQLTNALNNGDNLSIAVDELKDGNVWGPSLGRKLSYAGNRWLVARLAVRYDVDVVPLHMERLAGGCHRLVVGERFSKGGGRSGAKSATVGRPDRRLL